MSMISVVAAVLGAFIALCWRVFVNVPILSEAAGGIIITALIFFGIAHTYELKKTNSQLEFKLESTQTRLDHEMDLQEQEHTTWHRDEAMWFHFVLQRWYQNCGRGEGSLSEFLLDTLNGTLSALDGVSVIKTLKIHHLDLGARPPIVERVVPHRVAAKNQVFLDIHLHWPSEAAATAGLQLAGIGSAAPIAIKLNQIEFTCVLRLGLKLKHSFPGCLTDMSIAFVKSPIIDFGVEILQSVNLSGLPSIDSIILKLVQNAIKNCMVWPARIVIPFGEPEPELVETLDSMTPNPFENEQSIRSLDGDGLSAETSNKSTKADGIALLKKQILDHEKLIASLKAQLLAATVKFTPAMPCKGITMVNLIRAEDLIDADSNGLSDPFAVLTVENERRTSSVVNKSLNPMWKERFRWLVKDPATAVLRLELFDEDASTMDMLTFSGDDPLGMAQVGVWEVKDLVCKTGKDGRSRPLCTKDGEPEHYERWLELDEVDKGRVNVVVYYSDLVPLVPLNGAPLTKQQASAVRKAFATRPKSFSHTGATRASVDTGDMTVGMKFQRNVVAKKIGRKWSAKAKSQAEAKQLRADIQKMAQMNEAASESVAKGEEEMKGGDGTMDPAEGPSEERGDSELMTSIQKSMSHHSDLNLNSEADADADNADLEGAGGEAEHAEGNAEAASLADDLVVVAIMVQLLECKDLAPAGQLAVHARNPYVNFKLRDQSFKSTTGHTLHPYWDKEPQAFHFYTRLDAAELLNEGRCERLQVEVKDHHKLSSNESLGTAQIVLDGSEVGDVWVPLTKDGHHSSNHDGYHTGTDSTCGFVRLRIVPLAVPSNVALAVLRGQTQSGKASTRKVIMPTGPERVRGHKANGDAPTWIKDSEAAELYGLPEIIWFDSVAPPLPRLHVRVLRHVCSVQDEGSAYLGAQQRLKSQESMRPLFDYLSVKDNSSSGGMAGGAPGRSGTGRRHSDSSSRMNFDMLM
eukprot:CAMPEP_0182564334 /NCGR_PEP_ID=MMETSP1324-20130603/6294_1 /TAXON_ID=236786 /ORGANISM="Florenciella sp., Strain RCC1587" /LENGTH=972 /DNA_ID=CAMNT_0024777773 /DNA_START=114 /DNA_END=3030 /DNA_ORIENTATION=+